MLLHKINYNLPTCVRISWFGRISYPLKSINLKVLQRQLQRVAEWIWNIHIRLSAKISVTSLWTANKCFHFIICYLSVQPSGISSYKTNSRVNATFNNSRVNSIPNILGDVGHVGWRGKRVRGVDMAVHVRYNSWYISLPSSAIQQRGSIVKWPNSALCGECEPRRTIFLNF